MTAPVRYGIPNINDTQTVTEMVASGCHMIVFTTGAGSVVGQAVAPVIKGVSNSRVFQRLADDMDVNGGTIADGAETIDRGRRAHRRQGRRRCAAATPTRSEALGHQEFVLTYKTYEPLGPSCLPALRAAEAAEESDAGSPDALRQGETKRVTIR